MFMSSNVFMLSLNTLSFSTFWSLQTCDCHLVAFDFCLRTSYYRRCGCTCRCRSHCACRCCCTCNGCWGAGCRCRLCGCWGAGGCGGTCHCCGCWSWGRRSGGSGGTGAGSGHRGGGELAARDFIRLTVPWAYSGFRLPRVWLFALVLEHRQALTGTNPGD